MTVTFSSYSARVQCPPDVWSVIASNFTIEEAKRQFCSFKDCREKLDHKSEAAIFSERLLQGIDIQAVTFADDAEAHLRGVHGLDWKRQFGFPEIDKPLSNIERVDLAAKIVFGKKKGIFLNSFLKQYQQNRLERFTRFKNSCRKIEKGANLIRKKNLYLLLEDSLIDQPSLIKEKINDPDRGINISLKKKLFKNAVRMNYWEIIQDLLTEEGIQSVDLDKALIQYSREARMSAVLLRAGADCHAAMHFHFADYESEGHTALHQVACTRMGFNSLAYDPEVLLHCKVLMAAGADINARDSKGRTPLHYGVSSLDLAMIKLFIKLSADLNVKDSRGAPPLWYAMHYYCCGSKRIDGRYIFYKLLAAGANPNINVRGKTLLHYTRILEEKGQRDMEWAVRALCRVGVDINARDSEKKTPLHYVASLESTKIFIETGADVNARDNQGRTPLHYSAFQYSDPRNIKVFIEAGADINARDNEGKTPLIYAIGKSFYLNPWDRVLSILLGNNADPNLADYNGKTPLDYAKELVKKDEKNQWIVNSLLHAGAKAQRKWSSIFSYIGF